MKKPTYIFALIILVLCTSMFSDTDFKLKKTIAVNASRFTVDKFGNIYTAGDKLLQKFDSNFRFLYNYSDFNAGKIQLIDAGNPLKLILFYPDFAKIVILDAKLSPQAEINLRDINILQPTSVCNSYNENIWIFDLQNFQLKRIDKRQTITNESGNLVQILGYSPYPDFMLESGNWLYVNNPESGILVFDIYGTYYKTIPVKNLHSFRIINDQIFYQLDNKFGIYNTKLNTYAEYNTPDNNDNTISAILDKKLLYILKKDSLKIYSY